MKKGILFLGLLAVACNVSAVSIDVFQDDDHVLDVTFTGKGYERAQFDGVRWTAYLDAFEGTEMPSFVLPIFTLMDSGTGGVFIGQGGQLFPEIEVPKNFGSASYPESEYNVALSMTLTSFSTNDSEDRTLWDWSVHFRGEYFGEFIPHIRDRTPVPDGGSTALMASMATLSLFALKRFRK